MSIRWIKNILVDGEPTTIEVLLGDTQISDKCYVRINSGQEQWFVPKGESRDAILEQGITLIKNKFDGKKVTSPLGEEFDWFKKEKS